jgi:putative spermidine/putrescine transport system substrate-binding protein
MDRASTRSRRQFLKIATLGAGVAAFPGVLGACGSSTRPAASEQGELPEGIDASWPEITSNEVVVAGFGGETYETRHRLLFGPFTDLSGARVVDAAWDYGKFVTMVESANPEWDLIDFDGYSTVGLVEDGNAPAKLADWVRRCDRVDEGYRDYAAGGYAYSVVLGWSSDLDAAPRSWSDFFDTERFPGKRAFPKSIYAGTAELALMADGVAKDDLYPLDFDRAFAKLDEIKSDLVFYDSYAQGQQFIVQGSASMIATANSRMIQLRDTGQGDFTYSDAVLYPWSCFPMPASARHADAANALVDFLSHPQIQATVARELHLGPTVSEAFDLLTEQELALQPNSDENQSAAAVVDTVQAAEQDAEYVERFFAWVGQ